MMNKSKKILSVFFISILNFSIFAQSALELKNNALKSETVQDAIVYLNENIDSLQTPEDKRSTLYFLGTLQEQLGLYTDASRSYAKACGISAKDAEGFKKCSTEQMVLNAVRCLLCAGETEAAEKYLNSAVRSSSDEKIIAYVNLYSVWTALCKSQNYDDNADSVALLKVYSSMKSMETVKSQVLFTLWYLTGEEEYKTLLQKEFPSSPECGITAGKVQVASVPFWYFVPRQ